MVWVLAALISIIIAISGSATDFAVRVTFFENRIHRSAVRLEELQRFRCEEIEPEAKRCTGFVLLPIADPNLPWWYEAGCRMQLQVSGWLRSGSWNNIHSNLRFYTLNVLN